LVVGTRARQAQEPSAQVNRIATPASGT